MRKSACSNGGIETTVRPAGWTCRGGKIMIKPEYLKPGDTIAVTALSHSIDREPDQLRFHNGAKKLQEQGYNVVFTDNVFVQADEFGRSAPAEEKARQLHEVVSDSTVKAVYSAAGGDFLAEILPFVDLDLFRKNPKWVQGYSDNTSVLHYLTTKGGIQTAYGANFSDFGMEPWDLSVTRGLQVLEGSCRVQDSFETYQDGFGTRETGLEGYAPDGAVVWNCITEPEGRAKFKGRLTGGCMDVLLNIAGTPYDGAVQFCEKYKEDGIIWYLESFDLHFEQMMEGLWKLREMGWFRHASGIVFGRPLFYPTENWEGEPLPSYERVLLERLADLHIPVITGADIGHKGPQFVMINGAMAEISCADGKGRVTYL